jgi:hypothetical protein
MSRIRRLLRRIDRNIRPIAARALLYSGYVTEYAGPAVAGYFGGPATAAVVGAVSGVAGEEQVQTARKKLGYKGQNQRVKLEQAAIRGAVIAESVQVGRAATEYLSSSSGGSSSLATPTSSSVGGGSSASTQGAVISTTTKSGSAVEFNTATGTASVKTAGGTSSTFGLKDLSSVAGLGNLAGLLLSPGGQQLAREAGFYGSDMGGGGSVDPSSQRSADLLQNPAVLLALVFVALLLFMH